MSSLVKANTNKNSTTASNTNPSSNDKLNKITNSDQSANNEGEDLQNSILSDPEDYLEEDESLDMNLKNGGKKVWLVRLPRYLAEQWSKVDELSGQQLGRVKIKQNSGNGPNKLQVKLVLNENQNNDNIPREYDISMLNTQVQNSYIFSEENLQQFKQELTEVAEMPEQPTLQPIDKKKAAIAKPYKFFRVQKNKEGPDGKPIRKYVPYVKTIPKKTTLAGKICHDCQIVPSKSDSKYSEIISKRKNIQQAIPRPKVTLLNEIPGVIQSNAGPSIKGNNISLFLKPNQNKGKGEGRAIRMPKKDLLDLLFRLFEEYEYWSMKGLKERTRQPESYLKESLDSIANLIKKGPYTSKYNLKPEYRRLRDAERAARLGLEANEEDNDNDEEDDVEMEDVV